MESVVQADIFFLVSTVALILVTVVLLLVLFYAARILQDVLHIVHRVREEAGGVLGGIEGLRMLLGKVSSGFLRGKRTKPPASTRLGGREEGNTRQKR